MTVQHKELPFAGHTKVLSEEEGIVEAIVSVTGLKDRVNDNITPGAYEKTLSSRKPKGVWSHSWEQPIAKTLEARELLPGDPDLPRTLPNGEMWPSEAGGLRVKMQFNLDTQKGKDAYSNVKFFGEEQEWSIGYQVPPGGSEMDTKTDTRKINALELYEYSPVLFGAMPNARTVVKSEQEVLELLASAGVETKNLTIGFKEHSTFADEQGKESLPDPSEQGQGTIEVTGHREDESGDDHHDDDDHDDTEKSVTRKTSTKGQGDLTTNLKAAIEALQGVLAGLEPEEQKQAPSTGKKSVNDARRRVQAKEEPKSLHEAVKVYLTDVEEELADHAQEIDAAINDNADPEQVGQIVNDFLDELDELDMPGTDDVRQHIGQQLQDAYPDASDDPDGTGTDKDIDGDEYEDEIGKSAQEGETKRAVSTAERRGNNSTETMPGTDSYPVKNLDDLKNAVQAWGRSNPDERTKLKRHLKKQARRLSAPQELVDRIDNLDPNASEKTGEPKEEKSLWDVLGATNDIMKAIKL